MASSVDSLVVIASDSFKGTLSSREVADVVREELGRHLPGSRICSVLIADGGDNILRDIQFEKKITTEVVFRDFLIREIKNMSQEGRHIVGKMDDRVVIQPTP